MSRSAGPRELEFMRNRQCLKEGFKSYDIASVIVEEDGEPHTFNHCKDCYNLRQGWGKSQR